MYALQYSLNSIFKMMKPKHIDILIIKEILLIFLNLISGIPITFYIFLSYIILEF